MRSRAILSAFCILLGTAFPPLSVAQVASIRGFISLESSGLFLLPLPKQTSAKRLSITTSFRIRATLSALKTGDYVVVTGTLSDSRRDGKIDEVNVDAIESVGLSDLIGTWRSPKLQFVRFENYNTVSLFRPQTLKTTSNRMSLAKFRDLNYSLAPDIGSSYSIFLADKRSTPKNRGSVYVGRIQLQNSEALTLEIFNPKTGEPAEVLTLSPVRD